MRTTLSFAATGLMAAPFMATAAHASDLSVSVEIPRLSVAEYHKPYVAVWVEDANGKAVSTLAVWYQADKKNNEGTKWLSDMRTWWRKAGRSLSMPANGISSPTRGPGRQALTFTGGKTPFGKLAPGAYTLKVEAAREVGGREAVSLPFQWPPKGPQNASVKGKSELGTVSIATKP